MFCSTHRRGALVKLSTSGSGKPHYGPPTLQTDATISQANPVSGTKYEVLALTKNCRLIETIVVVTWTVQPTPLEVHITVDGILRSYSIANPVSASGYGVSAIAYTASGGTLSATYTSTYKPFIVEGKTIKVEVETTGGTVSNISARVVYAKW